MFFAAFLLLLGGTHASIDRPNHLNRLTVGNINKHLHKQGSGIDRSLPRMQLRSSSNRLAKPLSEPDVQGHEQQQKDSKRRQQQESKQGTGIPAPERVLQGDGHLLMEVLRWLGPSDVVGKASAVCKLWGEAAAR